jgi:hypothetical protein
MNYLIEQSQLDINLILNNYVKKFNNLINNYYKSNLNIIIVEDIWIRKMNKQYIIDKLNTLNNLNEKVCIIKFGIDINAIVPPISLEYKNDIINFIILYNFPSDSWGNYNFSDVLQELKYFDQYNIHKYSYKIIL